jgi:aminoglycoside phosphotransferase family enzyme/predicted kinase
MPRNRTSVLIKGLTKSNAYQHKVTSVSVLETHISWVLLTGHYAYKIKKPVNFGFLNFSTLENRHFFCHEEIRLNRRLAPDLYLEVIPITGNIMQPKMGGTGEIIEYAVKMVQFPAGLTLNKYAERGQLTAIEIDQLANIIANFHLLIDKAEVTSIYGHPTDIKYWFNENFDHISPLLVNEEQKHQLQKIQLWGNTEWNNCFEVMQQRKQQGYIRECHGDLHLSNMTLINGEVVLFDCIEFNPLLRWIDIISEVAFVFIDLLYFGYDDYAYRLLNHYFQNTGDYHGIAVLRYYLVYRALVSAKVALLQQTDKENLRYARFINLAHRHTQITSTTLIITHGYSGSGKSTYSGRLAEKIGAIQVRSDIERKRLFDNETPANNHSELYSQKITDNLYLYLANTAKTLIQAGFSTIIDATFLKNEQRNMFRQLAMEYKVKFIILDMLASYEELCARIDKRQDDVSDATIKVLQQQLQIAQGLSIEEQDYVITLDTQNPNAFALLIDKLQI